MHLDTKAPKREQALQLAGGPAKQTWVSHTPVPQEPSLPGPKHLAPAFTSQARCQVGKEPHLYLRNCQGVVIPHVLGLGADPESAQMLVLHNGVCCAQVRMSGRITVLYIESSTPRGAASLAASGELCLGSQRSCDANHHPLISCLVTFVPSIA